jgi:hypothetical protein
LCSLAAFSALALPLRGGSSTPPAYTDLCSTTGMSGNCVYAYSVVHRLNSTNTSPFTLTRISDSATYSAAYVGSAFSVDVSAETAFCLGHGGTTTVTTNYTTYNDCNVTEVFDQVSTCHLTPPQANKVFQFRTWNADGYPILLGTINQTNGNVGTTVPWLHGGGCSTVAGGVKKSIITYTNNGSGSNCCGEVGLMENGTGNPPAFPITAVSGTMIAESNYTGSGIGPSHILMATIDCEAACGTTGVEINTSPIIQGVTVGTFSGTVATGGTNKFNTWWNNVAGDVNVTPGQTINTQSRMSIGCDGDLLGCGPVAVRDMVITSTDVSATGGLPAAIYTYLTNIYAEI